MFFSSTGFTSTEQNEADVEVTLESMQMINESLIMTLLNDDEQSQLLESHVETSALINADIINESTLVRLSKKDRISQIQKVSVFTIAKEKGDPLFKKLMTVWRIERSLEDKLFKKYGNEGLRRAKSTVQKNYRQKGTAFVKINDRSTKVLNKAAGKKLPTVKKK